MEDVVRWDCSARPRFKECGVARAANLFNVKVSRATLGRAGRAGRPWPRGGATDRAGRPNCAAAVVAARALDGFRELSKLVRVPQAGRGRAGVLAAKIEEDEFSLEGKE